MAYSSGVTDFMTMAVEHACFNSEGNQMVKGIQATLQAFIPSSLLAAAGSLCLAPLSAAWGGDLVTVPYARYADKP
jgi:hypothetical protein